MTYLLDNKAFRFISGKNGSEMAQRPADSDILMAAILDIAAVFYMVLGLFLCLPLLHLTTCDITVTRTQRGEGIFLLGPLFGWDIYFASGRYVADHSQAGMGIQIGQVFHQEQTCYDMWELTGTTRRHTEMLAFSGQAVWLSEDHRCQGHAESHTHSHG